MSFSLVVLGMGTLALGLGGRTLVCSDGPAPLDRIQGVILMIVAAGLFLVTMGVALREVTSLLGSIIG